VIPEGSLDPHPFDGPLVVFDIETLGVTRDSVVYEVGALRVRLDAEAGAMDVLAEGHWRLHGRDQEGRREDPGTLEWMEGVPGRMDALAKARAEGVAVPEFLEAFRPFFDEGALGWCRGTHFDMVILEHLLEQHELRPPWRYDQVLDLRTLHRIAGYLGRPDEDPEMPHDALADCRCELPLLAWTLGKLRSSRG
jgi:hypothetical protein